MNTFDTPPETNDVTALRDQLGEALAEIRSLRLRLDVLATLDMDTGLPNLNGIVDAIETACVRQQRTGEPFGVVHVVFPGLDEAATRVGEDAVGDAVRHLAALLSAAVRGMDRVGRFDTTSFLVVAPQLDAAGVDPLVDRLVGVLTSMPVTVGNEVVDGEPVFSVVLSPAEAGGGADRLLTALPDARALARPSNPGVVTAP